MPCSLFGRPRIPHNGNSSLTLRPVRCYGFTFSGGVAQSVRACGSYPQCPGFKSLHRHQPSRRNHYNHSLPHPLKSCMQSVCKFPPVLASKTLLPAVHIERWNSAWQPPTDRANLPTPARAGRHPWFCKGGCPELGNRAVGLWVSRDGLSGSLSSVRKTLSCRRTICNIGSCFALSLANTVSCHREAHEEGGSHEH